jgi:dTDP-4-dehydrorhamnose reductase
MHFLLLGGTGQVGEAFCALPLPGDVMVVAPTRTSVDLTDPGAIASIIGSQSWKVVINAAAYTEVDRAESEQELAFAINAQAPALIATETASRGIPLIHISTDYVFDGSKGAPYKEHDMPAPLNVYGRSKLAGERAVMAANPRHVILRTSWVYSPYRKNFVRTILRLAAEREQLSIVSDQRGCPTAAGDVARACLDIAVRCSTEAELMPYGLFHFAGAGEATWFEFANAIVDLAGDLLVRPPEIIAIRTEDYPTPASRAADTRLDCTAFTRAFGIQQRPWQLALAETITRLRNNKGIS